LSHPKCGATSKLKTPESGNPEKKKDFRGEKNQTKPSFYHVNTPMNQKHQNFRKQSDYLSNNII